MLRAWPASLVLARALGWAERLATQGAAFIDTCLRCHIREHAVVAGVARATGFRCGLPGMNPQIPVDVSKLAH